MTDFLLVRHGETVWHAENRYAGRTDVPLTDRGREQARTLAHWAATAHLTAIRTSPLTRARLTAAPAADACGLTPHTDPRLTELDFGQGEGLTRDEMRRRFPQQLAAFLTDPADHHLPGGVAGGFAAGGGVVGGVGEEGGGLLGGAAGPLVG
ncbi:histidine phosphatase family protein, partial [Streptomyces sp. NRRL F-4489]|uniref:histidine phosphatase family protein n=1 Tax=Streptomyces sp. NRRL F-4489 TaxID=1609095 RepID=UPI000AB21C28